MLIQEYQEQWATGFEKIKEVLSAELNKFNITIEHVGSTAVPGLAAKPIIDVDIVYRAATQFASISFSLESAGYYHNGDQGIPGREVFKRKAGIHHPVLDRILHHLYVCREDSEELQRHLLFRNYLRANKQAADEYSRLKYHIADLASQDKKKYASLKEIEARHFIDDCLRRAKENASD